MVVDKIVDSGWWSVDSGTANYSRSGQWSVDSGQWAVPVLPLWEGDKIFLRLLLDEGTPFFSLKLVYENDEMTSATLNGRGVRVKS